MASSQWQRSLRQSLPSAVVAKKSQPTRNPTRKLSVVEEDEVEVTKRRYSSRSNSVSETDHHAVKKAKIAGENDVFDNVKSRRSVASQQPKMVAANSKPAAKTRPAIPKRKSSLTVGVKIPKPLDLSLVPKVKKEPLISPVPLPFGVECIDRPDHEAGLFAYWADFVSYLRSVEHQWLFRKESLLQGHRAESFEDNRAKLLDWIQELSHHFRASQETLYHTVALVDATFSIRLVEDSYMQLLGITAFLIACKLEEYHPPDIADLLKLTADSYGSKEVLNTELVILKAFAGHVHIADPSIFINRFLEASLDDSKVLKQAAFFFFDLFITKLEYSGHKASLKAAAAVYAARLVILAPYSAKASDASFDPWTPTLRYYTKLDEEEVAAIGKIMLKAFVRGLEAKLAGAVPVGAMKKYRSVSRHGNLLGHPRMNLSRAMAALEIADHALVFSPKNF